MTRLSLFLVISFIAGCCLPIGADIDLGPDQLALLHDSGGWEYLSMNSQNGFPTQHPCFDGKPHPDTCSGTLTLSGDSSFVQQVSIHHQTVARHGTYELHGNQLTFSDEFGTQDGPYSISVDTQNKMLAMNMPQVNVKLQLRKEYQKQFENKSKPKK